MTTPPAPPNAGKILVIDDNPIIQRTMYFALRDQGYTVLMCGEIAAGLKIARQERLAAILLDINFPPTGSLDPTSIHDGLWALGWLRRMDEVHGIPIVVISSDPPEKSQGPALAAGAAAYFQKPIEKESLAATLAQLLTAPKPAPGLTA